MDFDEFTAEYRQRKREFLAKEKAFKSLSADTEPQERLEKLRGWIGATLSYWEIYVEEEHVEMGVFVQVYKRAYNQCLDFSSDPGLLSQPRIPSYDLPIQGLQEIAALIDKGTKKPESTSKKRKRATNKEMAQRNKTISSFVAVFEATHERLPRVDEVADETGIGRKMIYESNSFKEGKIASKTSKTTQEMTGSSVIASEYYSGHSAEAFQAKRRTQSEQDELDALMDAQKADDQTDYAP